MNTRLRAPTFFSPHCLKKMFGRKTSFIQVLLSLVAGSCGVGGAPVGPGPLSSAQYAQRCERACSIDSVEDGTRHCAEDTRACYDACAVQTEGLTAVCAGCVAENSVFRAQAQSCRFNSDCDGYSFDSDLRTERCDLQLERCVEDERGELVACAWAVAAVSSEACVDICSGSQESD